MFHVNFIKVFRSSAKKNVTFYK